jgi:T-complex protein 1 subunit alpha
MMQSLSQPKQSSTSPLQIDGTRTSGIDVRIENVSACVTVANIVKSSLGPQGLDKMLVDDIGEVTVTNDGATILKNLEIEHPAAKILVESSFAQDKAVGDGTTSVVLIAAELLKRANELVKINIHPTNIISGYKLAAKQAIDFIKNNMRIKTEDIGKEALIQAAKTSMSSKIIGPESEFFAKMVVDAMLAVKRTTDGVDTYPVKAVHILKQHGQSARDSILLNGYALNCTRASQQMPISVKNAKIALLDVGLTRQKMKLGVQVLIEDPEKLEGVREREITLIKDRIKMILGSGANVILTTKGIDDLCLKYFVEANAIAVRRVKKEDLRRIATATGGTIVTSFADLSGNESFDSSNLGYADEVVETRIADSECIFIKGCKTTKAQSIIIRGANDFMLDEIERALHDSLCVVKRVLESKYVVAGGGAVEAALSIYLERFATTLESREQLAIAEFAEAVLVIPRTLAVNAACDATDLVAKLRAIHNEAQRNPEKKNLANYGLDLWDGKVRDNLKAGVLEPALTKIKSIRFATEAAITILRIDDKIKINPKPEPERPR